MGPGCTPQNPLANTRTSTPWRQTRLAPEVARKALERKGQGVTSCGRRSRCVSRARVSTRRTSTSVRCVLRSNTAFEARLVLGPGQHSRLVAPVPNVANSTPLLEKTCSGEGIFAGVFTDNFDLLPSDLVCFGSIWSFACTISDLLLKTRVIFGLDCAQPQPLVSVLACGAVVLAFSRPCKSTFP